jgi:hypothetical protein
MKKIETVPNIDPEGYTHLSKDTSEYLEYLKRIQNGKTQGELEVESICIKERISCITGGWAIIDDTFYIRAEEVDIISRSLRNVDLSTLTNLSLEYTEGMTRKETSFYTVKITLNS